MKIGSRVRSSRDGQLGYLVEGESGIAVRLDRKAENRVVPFRASEWVPDVETRLTPMQIARVTYEADKALRLVMGEYGLPDWVSLKEPVRIEWMKGQGDGIPEIRRKLHQSILKVLAK